MKDHVENMSTDLGDLLKLYSFESVHNTPDETAIADWICKKLDSIGVKDYKRVGNNIYRLSHKEIILSAHLDQVKTNGKAVKFYLQDDKIVAYNNKWERTSLGADDKNGIWIILQALEAGKEIDFIISEGEECGCVGITALEDLGVLDAIDPSSFCLVLDRRGYQEILKGGSTDVYCATLAQDLCNFLGGPYNVGTGSISDTRVLCCYCESVNIATAYEGAHTSLETTNWQQLQELRDDILDVIDNFIHYSTDPNVYLKSYKTSKSSNYWGGKYYDYGY